MTLGSGHQPLQQTLVCHTSISANRAREAHAPLQGLQTDAHSMLTRRVTSSVGCSNRSNSSSRLWPRQQQLLLLRINGSTTRTACQASSPKQPPTGSNSSSDSNEAETAYAYSDPGEASNRVHTGLYCSKLSLHSSFLLMIHSLQHSLHMPCWTLEQL